MVEIQDGVNMQSTSSAAALLRAAAEVTLTLDAQPRGSELDEDITTSLHTSQGEEEVQHGRPIHLFHGGGPVQLKLESISGFRISLP